MPVGFRICFPKACLPAETYVQESIRAAIDSARNAAKTGGGEVNTDCSKCKEPMRAVPKATEQSPLNLATFTVTGFLCKNCGYWNDLKRRKSWKLAERAK
jgi:hypothetical protein